MIDIPFANYNDLLPELKQRFGHRCPPDDVLRDIVNDTVKWTLDKCNKILRMGK